METAIREGEVVHASFGSKKEVVVAKANSVVERMRTSMAMHPGKWVAIAAGTGFALGLGGRFLQWRQRRARPEFLIVEA